MTQFRPCIDLHKGKVKQIVGGSYNSLGDDTKINFESDKPSSWFASQYKKDGLEGGHIIQIGPGNEPAAREALSAYPGGLQIGGGISASNAGELLKAGASKVIVTSWLFPELTLDWDRLKSLSDEIGVENLVVDFSCRRAGDGWVVAKKGWQVLTSQHITKELLQRAAAYCSEFLIHAVDVEGKMQGIDAPLVEKLAEWTPLPTTYAGGARNLDDLVLLDNLSQGKLDLTIGSALDIFGGTGAKYAECVAFNKGTRR